MMQDQIVNSREPVLLLGGGAVAPGQIQRLLKLTGTVIAADGGANMALEQGVMPDWVIGDFDSVLPQTLAAIPATRQMHIAEQDSTDFEKCLMRIKAPLVIGLGFMGPRVDHAMAVWNALVRYPDRPCVVVGERDLVFAAPRQLRLDLQPGTRLSLFPMAAVGGTSRGLRWPIDGLTLAPDGRIGTSNMAEGPVDLTFAGPGMLVILPERCLGQAVAALTAAPPG
ncbi:MAG: thiamine diphosphokinase [Paracoccaceae bacterium]